MASADWIYSLKVTELKAELKKRGLIITGNKAELVERLETYVKDQEVSGL